jgi:hypothetical protein
MSKSKYFYIIVDKENGQMLLEDGKLPFYWNKKIAKERCVSFDGYVVHKLLLSEIETMILQSKKA